MKTLQPIRCTLRYYALLQILVFIHSAAKPQSLKLSINLIQTGVRAHNNNGTTQDKYFVVMSTHAAKFSSDPEINSPVGHAWVVLIHENPQAAKTEVNGYGFWPNEENTAKTTGKIVARILTGATALHAPFYQLTVPGRLIADYAKPFEESTLSVPGFLKEEIFGTNYFKEMKQVVFQVDANVYKRSMSVVETYQSGHPNYSLAGKDCLAFFIEVGQNLGINMPYRDLLHPKSLFPDDYGDLFISELQRKGLLTQDGTGKLQADYDGSYSYTFNGGKDKNQCFINRAGETVEDKIRNSVLTSREITYPNGNVWYSETSGQITKSLKSAPLDKFMPPPPITSEMTFVSGNTVIGFDPERYNPNYVLMQLVGEQSSFVGAINSVGQPNGYGILKTLRGETVVSSVTGIFSNGAMITKAIPRYDVGNAIVQGQLQDEFLQGDGIIEYKDGYMQVGNFVHGQLNGNGTISSKNNNFYLSGQFKDGKPNGYCMLRNSSGYYAGAFVEGQLTGKGTWITLNGVTCTGDFLNGRFISGRASLKDGTFYVGTFNTAGKIIKAKHYDKNGKEIKQPDRNFSGSDRDRSTSDYKMQLGDGPWEGFKMEH